MFGLGSKKNALYGVLVDIGSGSVAVAIVKSDHTEKVPHILFSHRVYTHIGKSNTAKADHMRKIREALFSASLILSKDGLQALTAYDPHAKIQKIFVTCSSPWALTVARNVSYENEEELKISDALINDLIKSAEQEIEEKVGESGITGSLGLEIVERTTVDIRINEYSVARPIGLHGKQIDLTHITGLIPKEILEAVYEVQDKVFTGAHVHAHTFMLVMYCVLRDIFPKLDAHIIINVTAEATEFGIVENGTLVETISTPYGANTLLRDITENSNKTAADALTRIRGYTENTLTEHAHTEIEALLTPYTEAIQKTLGDIMMYRAIPNTCIITAQPQYNDLFKQLITRAIDASTKVKHTSLMLPKEAFENILLPDTSPDIFITASARFFHKLHGCGEMDTH